MPAREHATHWCILEIALLLGALLFHVDKPNVALSNVLNIIKESLGQSREFNLDLLSARPAP